MATLLAESCRLLLLVSVGAFGSGFYIGGRDDIPAYQARHIMRRGSIGLNGR